MKKRNDGAMRDTMKFLETNHRRKVSNSALSDRVIFRCGWCGMPTDKDGNVLPGINGAEKCDKYLEDNKGAKEALVSGSCCPNGNGR